jgi:hypothetical protein
MIERGFWNLRDVSDARLMAGLRELLAAGSRVEARLVAHLAEVDARRLALRHGRSLFEYCRVELGLSENQAHYRIAAARVGRRFPVVFEMLERREVHMTTLSLLSRHLTRENHVELLNVTRGLTKLQVLELLAMRWPKADVLNGVRQLPVPANAVAAGPTGTLEPRSEQRYRLQLNVDAELKEQLELARDLLRHANPTGDLAVVVKRALRLLVADLQKKRFAKVSKPRVGREKGVAVGATGATEASGPGRTKAGDNHAAEAKPAARDDGKRGRARDHIRNDVRREVAERDGQRCCFVGENGQRCEARGFIEFDHRLAWAKRPDNSAGNLRLLCRAHNQLLAEQTFGAAHIAAAIARRRRSRRVA